MKVSFSVSLKECGNFKVELSNMKLPEDLMGIIDSKIEIYDILLLRETGKEYTPVKVLNAIADKIANFLLQNNNVMLFFLCEDIIPIPHTRKNIPPQEYRSKLFSALFQNYIRRHNIKGVNNYPICVRDFDNNPMYMHIFAKEENEEDVMIIYNDIIANYSK